MIVDREGLGGRLVSGQGVSIDDTASIDISADVFLADRVAISDEALVLTHDHEPGSMAVRSSPLHVGAGAWLAARCIVLESCDRIGEGSVVAAGAVVTRDIPDRELWGGVPARFIRKL